MLGRNVNSVVRGLAVAAALAAASAASAQEAIRLETIGAVRMAQPQEVQRMAIEQESVRAQAQRQPREEQEASAR